ncbi:type I-E CRISPR-associated protein Cse2/CasB [Candidatus Electrothrix sp.]|uniref:type I-E CRISPR-associated protein Cse2/CasB n=1 Tax=Candidatus Electrothrix sp. TaxID=2170559 RepID=UPI004056EDE1
MTTEAAEAKNTRTINAEQQAVLEWWQALQDNKGGRAELRRAKELEQVFFSPEFYSLYNRLAPLQWRSREKLALLAGVLAHVRTHTAAQSVAKQMASPGKSGSKAVLSGLRFRRLLKHETAEELYGPMIRVIRLLDKKINIADLAQSLYWWNSRTKMDWSMRYYKKAP